jgi:hypothetical protein
LKKKWYKDNEIRFYKSIWHYLDPQESDREKEFLLYKNDPILEQMIKELHKVAQEILWEKNTIVSESKKSIRKYEQIQKLLPCIKIT